MVRTELEIPVGNLVCIAVNQLFCNKPGVDVFITTTKGSITRYVEIRNHVSVGQILGIINHTLKKLKEVDRSFNNKTPPSCQK